MGRVTLQTVADHAGVSRMTVSNAFSRPDQLSSALRERILGRPQLGYAGPDPAARVLARGPVGSVGVLLTGSLTRRSRTKSPPTFVGAVPSSRRRSRTDALSCRPHGDVVPARDVAIDGALVYTCDPSLRRGWLGRRDSRWSRSTRSRGRVRPASGRRPRRCTRGRPTSPRPRAPPIGILTSDEGRPARCRSRARSGESPPRVPAADAGLARRVDAGRDRTGRDPGAAQVRGGGLRTRPPCCWTARISRQRCSASPTCSPAG